MCEKEEEGEVVSQIGEIPMLLISSLCGSCVAAHTPQGLWMVNNLAIVHCVMSRSGHRTTVFWVVSSLLATHASRVHIVHLEARPVPLPRPPDREGVVHIFAAPGIDAEDEVGVAKVPPKPRLLLTHPPRQLG